MTKRYIVDKPVTEDGKLVFPVLDTENNKKRVRDGLTLRDAQRIAYHYNLTEVWND